MLKKIAEQKGKKKEGNKVPSFFLNLMSIPKKLRWSHRKLLMNINPSE